jgi:hypothetical protein
MKLMTKALAKKIPALYSTDGLDINTRKAYARYYLLGGVWEWYALEYDGNDICFGLVFNEHGDELGYFSLSEMAEIKMPLTWVERDLYFETMTVREVFLKRIEDGV